MADYQSALNTSLGDYLNFRASQEGTTRDELEKKLAIEPIRIRSDVFLFNPVDSAIIKFNEVASKYKVVVELREGIGEVGVLGYIWGSYIISGTGIIIQK